MAATPAPRKPGLKRSLSVWQAVGLSMAAMAPSKGANINPQGAIGAGRAVPLAFLIAAFGVTLVAYTFVRLCQYFRHSGSVYAFVGATLGPQAGVIAGWGLAGVYTFFTVGTAAAAGIFGAGLLDSLGIWTNQPAWSPMLLAGAALALALVLAAMLPARRGTKMLLVAELATAALILFITAVVLVRLISGHAPGGEHFTWSVFSPQPGAGVASLFLGVVFGFLSFGGFEASATLGEEARNPSKDIPRAIIGVVAFSGVFLVVVTAAEIMGFGTSGKGLAAFAASPSLLGDLGTSYVGSWMGTMVTLGITICTFGGCLASTAGAARIIYAISRDSFGERGAGRTSRWGTPTWATGAVAVLTVVIYVVCVAASAAPSALAMNAFRWSGMISALIMLVAYLLATVGMTLLVFVRRRMPSVPMWQVVIPVTAVAVLGYTLYRSVYPYPTGDGRWFPVVAGGWLLAAVAGVLLMPSTSRRLGEALTAREGIAAEHGLSWPPAGARPGWRLRLAGVSRAAADSVAQGLIGGLLQERAARGIGAARGDSGEKGKPGGPPLQLTTAQWAKLHRIAIEAVRREGGTQEVAERVANMLVTVGHGVLEQEQP
jgi:amino acid transporter